MMLLLASISLAGCSHKAIADPVILNTEKTDSTSRATLANTFDKVLRIDSVIRFDSVFERIIIKGDTVFHERDKTSRMQDVRIVHDTVRVETHDTIYLRLKERIEVPVHVYHERRLSPWETIKQRFGGIAICVCCLLLFALFVCAGLYYKRGCSRP